MSAALSSVMHRLIKKAGEARFYVTYGFGTNLQNCYSELFAQSIEEARELAFATTKGKHAFLYSSRDWMIDGKTQAEAYNLREVPLQPQKRAGTYFGRVL